MPPFKQVSLEDVSLISHPDPVALELNRLQNQLKENERELEKSQSELRALRASEALKDRALEELGCEVKRLDEKLRFNVHHLEQKNLEIKKLTDAKKEALSAQYAVEATLRRVYVDKKDDNSVPIGSVIAPLEAELKILKNQVTALQEDKRALERLTKCKEAALLQAEKILKSALERALIAEDVQNQNLELRRQIEICQDENKILDKKNRQKVWEVEKLSQTIKELEEAILAGGAAANSIRDYRRQISELNAEKKTLERELARIKVSENRIATAVANEWKDDTTVVRPAKQWLEERRILQAEMQKLKDKLVVSDRAAQAEAQVNEKLRLRMKTLEEGLKHSPIIPTNIKGSQRTTEKSHSNFFGILSSNTGMKKQFQPQSRTDTSVSGSKQMMDENQMPHTTEEMMLMNTLKKKKSTGENLLAKKSSGESVLRKSMRALQSEVIDNNENEDEKMNENATVIDGKELGNTKSVTASSEVADIECMDMVSGFLYDKLQKEVIQLRKFCHVKETTLNSKEEEIKILMKKIERLNRVLEVETKKMKREVLIREKDSTFKKVDERIKAETQPRAEIPLSDQKGTARSNDEKRDLFPRHCKGLKCSSHQPRPQPSTPPHQG